MEADLPAQVAAAQAAVDRPAWVAVDLQVVVALQADLVDQADPADSEALVDGAVKIAAAQEALADSAQADWAADRAEDRALQRWFSSLSE